MQPGHYVADVSEDFADPPRLFRPRKSLLLALGIMRRSNPRKFWFLAVMAVVQGVLPALFAPAAGHLIDTVQGMAEADGFSSAEGRSFVLALGLSMLIFAGSDIIGTYTSAVVEGFKAQVNAHRRDRVMRAALVPPGIRHLEDPEFLDAVRLASSREWPDVGSFAAGTYGLLVARITSLASAAILFTYKWWLAIALVIAWSVIGFYLRLGQAEGFAAGRADLRRATYFRRLAYDGIAAKEVRIFGLSQWILDRFATNWLAVMELVWAKRRRRMNQRFGVLAAALLANAIAFLTLVSSVNNGEITVAQLAVYGTALLGISTLAQVNEWTMAVSLGSTTFPAVVELEQKVREDPALVMSGSRAAEGLPHHEIVFEDVSFTYPGQSTPVFDRFSLHIEAGKSLGIVGRNGAGKTTLIKLLARFYDPVAGRILVDGIDLRELEPTAWQRRVAAIFQDFVRWQFSAADNVGFGAVEARTDIEALERAVARVGADDLVRALPAGWDTTLSRQFTGGADLSGGQWQRLALARAIFAVDHGAGVLVLDEPTANLDARAEVELFDRFLEVTKGATALLISHRFSTVRRADRIVVIDGGEVVEDGDHAALVQLGGRYAAAFRLQADRYASVAEDELAEEPL